MNDLATLKKTVADTFRKFGADIIVCGPASRFRDHRIFDLMPEVKTVLCAAYRVLRGVRRGIEEGTTYYDYTTMGVENMEEVVMPMGLLRACAVLEDAGFRALPQRRTPWIMNEKDSTNPEVDYTEIYRGKEAETLLDFEQCAVDAGLGERGLSGTVLTDDFGPCQRYVFLLTDAELPADPAVTPHLCDHCGKCVQGCPGHAISPDGKLDCWRCAVYYNGACAAKNPYMPADAFADDPERDAIIAGEAKITPQRAREIIDQLHFYPPMKHSYPGSICGRACDTECYIHLEEKGALRHTFRLPFRIRPAWHLTPLEPEEGRTNS